MERLYVGMEDALLVVPLESPSGMREELRGAAIRCVAVDAEDRSRIYCGTADRGLWRSEDGGASWHPAGRGLGHDHVTAVATGALPRAEGGSGVVYAGTEPSAVFRSEDGGATWGELGSIDSLPSSAEWSFPPRPETHHVRWISPDPLMSDRIFVAIEAGALIRSRDGGETWEDRRPGGPRDTHTLVVHPRASGRLFSAAGDGCFESRDGGDTWERSEEGLRHRYAWGCAVDPEDPDTVVVSTAASATRAHSASHAESWIYRRAGGSAWEPVTAGLPEPSGTTISMFIVPPGGPEAMYAANNRGLFHSADLGRSWTPIELPWPSRFREQRVTGLALG